MVTRSRLANLKTAPEAPPLNEPRPNVPPQSSRNVQVHLVGNSIIGGIDPARLSTEKVHVKKSMVYTIDEAKSLKYNSADMIIFQLGSNDLKKKNPEQVVMDMDNLINKIHRHNPECKIVVSLVPHQKPTMNSKIKMLNTTWKMKFKNTCVIVASNNNIDNGCLRNDGVHLNNRGIGTLAANLTNLLRPTVNKPMQRNYGQHYQSYARY
jgi:hypothetical protein